MEKVAIFSITNDLCIGVGDSLAVRSKEDLSFFKGITDGTVLLMGTNTMNSLPIKLPNRYSIAVSRTPTKYISEEKVDVVLPFDMDLIENEAKSFYDKQQVKENVIHVIGGASLIERMFWEIDTFIITKFDIDIGGVEGGVYFDGNDYYHLEQDFDQRILKKCETEVTLYTGEVVKTTMTIYFYSKRKTA